MTRPLNSSADRAGPNPSGLAGGATLRVSHVATALGVSSKHVVDLIVEGALVACDFRGRAAQRACYRIPVEAFWSYLHACHPEAAHGGRFAQLLPRDRASALVGVLEHILIQP